MSVYQLILDFLNNYNTFYLQEYSDQTYIYKIKGKTHYLKLNKQNKFKWLQQYNAHTFISNNLNFDDSYDLHGCISPGLFDILDAILDYNFKKKTYSFFLITGNGNIVKPKVISYLKKNNLSNKKINIGCIEIKLFRKKSN